MEWLQWIDRGEEPRKRPELRPGDDVRVWFRIRELGKERLAQFEGVVIRVRGSGCERTCTVRRLTHGVGVERVFPLDAQVVNRVEVLRRTKVKRARLYFLRDVIKTTRLASAEEAREVPAATEPGYPPKVGGRPECREPGGERPTEPTGGAEPATREQAKRADAGGQGSGRGQGQEPAEQAGKGGGKAAATSSQGLRGVTQGR